jgi:polyisoprenyl-teichoic acid--peptidoglycan teichoic acid transferase
VSAKSPPASVRLPTILVVLALVVATGFIALRSYARTSNADPVPTAVAMAMTEEPATATPAPIETPIPVTEMPSPEPTDPAEDLATQPVSTPSRIPSRTATATATSIPTITPTSRPQLVPTLATLPVDQNPGVGEVPGVSTAIPTPVPTFEVPLGTTNILLLGSDTDLDQGAGRTDTMIILAINRDGPTASMVSIPRDLFVYIPGWTMNRINTVLSRNTSYPGGSIAQLRDTILYNFGVPIHYYAQVDFAGFQQAVDILGGVKVAVSCSLRDIWELKSPELDPLDIESWEWHTLEPGVYDMDGSLALWYARSRRTTTDFDRGRRQQQLLRAILNQAVDLNMLPQLPEFWNTYQETVKTDMDIGRMLQLATLAPGVRENGVQHLYIVGDQLQPWTIPESGAAVQLPVWSSMQETFQRLFLPPALNRASRPPITVEIISGTNNRDLSLLAADNLAWYGFLPVINDQEQAQQEQTTIEYFAQNTKGSFDWLLSWILDQATASIQLVPDTPYEYNYRVVLGSDYDPCRPQLYAPQAFLEQQQ